MKRRRTPGPGRFFVVIPARTVSYRRRLPIIHCTQDDGELCLLNMMAEKGRRLGVEIRTYSLEIAADGFPAKRFVGATTERAVNLGDIPLD